MLHYFPGQLARRLVARSAASTTGRAGLGTHLRLPADRFVCSIAGPAKPYAPLPTREAAEAQHICLARVPAEFCSDMHVGLASELECEATIPCGRRRKGSWGHKRSRGGNKGKRAK
eukprot:TRINITY_DN50488_c0_g1_i2.p1 TRINITY_DN50488_c0_g1~~TRINITY_DN50488_c0_g1_i2.p1  ORF type:complete len:116 (+),score=16.92 TRINITY_DN50488_c0_g1_i2:114-461(+)